MNRGGLGVVVVESGCVVSESGCVMVSGSGVSLSTSGFFYGGIDMDEIGLADTHLRCV